MSGGLGSGVPLGRCGAVHPSPAWYLLGWCRAWEAQLSLGSLPTHPLVPVHQVPSCSPTLSCWCSVASPSSSWSSPSGSLPARAALASGGSAPCSKVRSCLSLLAHASMGHLLSQCPAAGVTLAHRGAHAHLWHITWPGAGTRGSCSPAHRSRSALHLPTLATLPCTARLASPARVTRAPAHASHLLHKPQPCAGIHCGHYTHIPAYATRVPSVSLLQRPLRSPEHTVACPAVGMLLQLSPWTIGSRCSAHVLALPWLDPAPGASPALPVCSHAAGSPGPRLQAACQVTCPRYHV